MHDENGEPTNRLVVQHEAEDEVGELTPAQLGHMLIDNTASLHNQDQHVYRKLCTAIIDEVQGQSIFDYIDADDHAHNLAMEGLFRRAMMATFEQNKTSASNTSIKTKKELRGELIKGPVLETMHKLAKLEDHYGRNRRFIGDKLRTRAESRKMLTSAPVQSLAGGAEESPSIAPHHGQANEGVD